MNSNCNRVLCRLACLIPIDGEGNILLQEKDEFAPVDPGMWAMLGGHCKEGEEPIDAAKRELLEETGLELVFQPRLVARVFTNHCLKITTETVDEFNVFVVKVPKDVEKEIVVKEGKQICFMPEAEVYAEDRKMNELIRSIIKLAMSAETNLLIQPC